MRIEVLVPNLPESVSDATLLDWHYQAGQSVTKDTSLIDLETDKVVLEVPVPETWRATGSSPQQGRYSLQRGCAGHH